MFYQKEHAGEGVSFLSVVLCLIELWFPLWLPGTFPAWSVTTVEPSDISAATTHLMLAPDLLQLVTATETTRAGSGSGSGTTGP